MISAGRLVINTQLRNDSHTSGKAGRIDGCARIFDGKLMTTKNEPERGLSLMLNRAEVMSDFCKRIIEKKDKFSTNYPRSSLFANTLTQAIIRAGGISWFINNTGSPVISMYENKLHHAFPKWRHLSQINRCYYLQKALNQKCTQTDTVPIAMTIRLSHEFARTIIGNSGAGYLLERLTLKFKRSLNRSPDMWLILEATTNELDTKNKGRPKRTISWSKGLLHVHGAIALYENEKAIFKKIVRDLNDSSNSKFLNNELRLKLIENLGWVDYCHKNSFLNDCFLAGIQRFSRSNSLHSLARKLYENDRSLYKAVLRSKSGAN